MNSSVEALPKTSVPCLRLHKPSGQFVADIDGKTLHLGKEEDAAWKEFLSKLSLHQGPVEAASKVLFGQARLNARSAELRGSKRGRRSPT